MASTPHRDDVRIIEFPDTPVARLSHVGTPEGLGDTIRRFIEWRRGQGLSPARAATWTIIYDDPDDTPIGSYRVDLCVTCVAVPDNDAGIGAWRIPGGRCAVLRHVGSDALLRDTVAFLYGEWLSASGEALRDAPLFFRRVAFFPDVPEYEAIIDIHLPLAAGPAVA